MIEIHSSDLHVAMQTSTSKYLVWNISAKLMISIANIWAGYNGKFLFLR